jgi:putative Mg2+ transporter-C (MgtC) family protein
MAIDCSDNPGLFLTLALRQDINMDSLELIQVLVALSLGFLIGIERQMHGSNAGLRTCALVSMGACLFGLASTHVHGPTFYHSIVDPSRIAAQIVTGVGFLGGGVIFRDKNNTRGLTTAAIIWITAAIGLAVAFEMFFLAVLTTALCILVLTMNRWSIFSRFFGADRNETKMLDE